MANKVRGYCDDCHRPTCPICDNCDCDGYPCVHQTALRSPSDVQAPPAPASAPVPDLTPPAVSLRRFQRHQAIPRGILARGRSGRIAPQRWEAFTDDQGQAWITLHSQKPSVIPPVVISGPAGDLLGLLEAMYWGVRDAVEGADPTVDSAPVENAVSGSEI